MTIPTLALEQLAALALTTVVAAMLYRYRNDRRPGARMAAGIAGGACAGLLAATGVFIPSDSSTYVVLFALAVLSLRNGSRLGMVSASLTCLYFLMRALPQSATPLVVVAVVGVLVWHTFERRRAQRLRMQ